MSAPPRRFGLVAVWLVLGTLAVVILVLDGGDILSPPSNGTHDEPRLFAFAEPDLGGIQVVYQRQIATLMRGADGLWYQHDDSHSHGGVGPVTSSADADEPHVPDPAQSEAIAARLMQVSNMVAERQALRGAAPEATGLARSETMIAFYGRNEDGADLAEPMTILRIGKQRPGSDTLYARLDSETDLALVAESDFQSLLAIVFGEGNVPAPDEE